MSPATGTVPPPISWAQRVDLLYVVVDVECKDIEYKVTEDSFTFKGTNALDANKKYEVKLNFLNSVIPEEVTSNNIGRCIEYTIPKKQAGPFWKSLTNDKTKLHFLKANFAKWKNESDDEDGGGQLDYSPTDQIFNDLVQGSGNRFDDFNIDDDDDSDDNIPSLYQNDDEDDKKDEEKKDQEK